MGPEFCEGRHTVGYWFWEVERFPPRLHAAFDAVDEVWAATDFVADAVRAAGRKPVFTVPVPLTIPRQSPHITRDAPRPARSLRLSLQLRLPEHLRAEEPAGARPGLCARVRTRQRAAAPDQDDQRPHPRSTISSACEPRSAIGPTSRLVDGYYTAAEKDALVGLCDCYVSLHRSEGLGLTMAEAMAAGKPVIATGYSGNMQFMTPANSFLVDYVLTKVPANCQPYPEGTPWADPDLDHAARLMRSVYAQPDEAAATGQRARARTFSQRHGVDASAAAIAQRLESIRRDRRARIAVPAPPVAAAAAATTAAARARATAPPEAPARRPTIASSTADARSGARAHRSARRAADQRRRTPVPENAARRAAPDCSG